MAVRMAATSVFLLLLALCDFVLSQTGPQNASIPNCVRACDNLAYTTANCTSEDQYCHCVRSSVILDTIIPCVQHNSTCANATADLLTFESLFADVCQKFNISIPTNATGNSTPVYTPAPKPSTYTSEATVGGVYYSFGAIAVTAFCFIVFL